MKRRSKLATVAMTVAAASLALAGCSGTSSNTGSSSAAGTSVAGAPSWCGPKQISLGLLDGFGGNSWRLVTTAAGAEEAKLCPSVTNYEYADGQGNTQKAISDIQGMVAKGVNALVVFPDAGQAMLPALRSAYKAGVVTVPYRVFPGGKDGVDYDAWIGADFTTDGQNWGNWIKTNLPDGGNILFISGPKGNSQAQDELKGVKSVLTDSKYNYIGETPEVTNWDPALTQQVLTADIAKYPKIDVIVSDFGPSLVGALPAFAKGGRSIPAVVTSDGNSLGCFYLDNKDKNPDFKLMTVATGNDNVRLAVDYAVAKATGGKLPADTVFKAPAFEDSVSGKPSPVQCKKDLPGDIYLSAKMSPEGQAALLKK
jgi:ribose transport system substrate-binding protein